MRASWVDLAAVTAVLVVVGLAGETVAQATEAAADSERAKTMAVEAAMATMLGAGVVEAVMVAMLEAGAMEEDGVAETEEEMTVAMAAIEGSMMAAGMVAVVEAGAMAMVTAVYLALEATTTV